MPIIKGFDGFESLTPEPKSGVIKGFADYEPVYRSTVAPPESGDFTTGIKQSGLELAGTAYGLAGLAGAGLGAEGLKQWGLENAQRKFAESGAMGKEVYSLEGINSVGDAIDYLQRGVGYVGAQAIPAILTGGIGSTVAKKFVEQGVKELAKKTVAGSAAEQAAIMAAKQQVGKASTRGAIGSMGITGYGQAAGSLYPEMVSEGYDEPGRAALYAAPIAALDVIPAARAARQILMPGARKGILKEIRNQAAGESVTELGQTGLERQAAYKDLTSPEARSEYLNAMALGALGGGILGGAGAALNNRALESNILSTANPTADEQKPLLGIGYTPAAGTPTIFPDGSQALGSEQVSPITEAAPAVASAIDQEILDAASGLGLNLNNTKGKPLPRKVELFTKAFDLYKAGAIDDAVYTQTVERLKKRGKHDDVEVLLTEADTAFVEKQRLANQPKFQRAPKPENQNVGTNVPAAGGLAPSVAAGGTDVSGGLATTGSALNVGPSSDVGSRVAGISPAGNETSLLGNVTGKSPTTLTLRAGAPASGMAQTSLEDQLAIGELTGNAAEAQALTEEEAGQRIDVTDTDESRAQDINAILDKAFENSEDKARDIEIAKMYLEVMKNAPQGFKQKIQDAIGEPYGIKAGAVRKISQTPALVDAAVSMGMTRQQALDLLEISDTSKNKVSTTAGEQAGGLETVATELGVDFQENDSIGFGYDDTRTWSQSVKGAGDTVNATDEAIANAIYTLSEKVNSVSALADKFPAIAGTLREMKAKLEETLAKTMQSAAGRLKSGSKPTPRKTKAKEVAEDETKLLTDEQVALNKEQEARQAARAASRKGLEVGDTVQNPKLGTGTVQSFSGDGDATMAEIAFQSGQTKNLMLSAAKLEKIASAPVTEKAPVVETTTPKKTKAGKAKAQVTGRDVWENLQKDTPGLGDYDGLSKREKDYVEEVAARTNGDFTLVSEPSMEVVIDNHINEEQTEDIYTEDFEADDGTALRMVRGDTIEVTAGTLKFTGTAETLENLRRYEGVNAAIRRYENDDANSVVDKVELWLLAPNTVDFDAAVMTVQGKRTVAIRRGVLLNTSKAEYSIHHELGHIADEALATGGVFSGHEDMNLDVKNNVVKAYGPVAKEVLDFYNANPDSSLSKQLAYPLDRAKHGKLATNETRFELFAQLWAIYNDPDGRSSLDESLPKTYQFIEDAYEAQKQSPDRTVQSAVTETPAGTQAVADNRGAQGGVRVKKSDAPKVLKLKANKEKILNSDAAKKVSNTVSKTLNAIVFTEDLFKRAVKAGIAAAKKMDTIYRERTNLEGQIERDVERVASLYNKIPVKERGTGDSSANKYVYDMTREKKWGFEPTWRTGTSEKVKIDDKLSKRWDGLSQESRDWVEAVFAHGDQMLKLKKQTLMDATNSEYDALIKDAQAKGNTAKVAKFQADKKAQLAQFARLFAVSEFNPYAPMKRFGNYVVTAKSQKYLDASEAEQAKLQNDPDQYHVSFAESMASGLELQRELEAEGSFAKVETFEKEKALSSGTFSGALSAFTELRNRLDSELSNATDPEDRNTLAKARAVVADLYLASLAENSARKSEMRRKGVAGEIDMLRSFATQGRADAQFLATAKYTSQMSEAINQMRRETKQGGDRLEKSQLFNEIMARHNQSLTYDDSSWSDVAAKASRVTSVWMLATSPMYYLQNLTQPIMLSVPFMAGRHNYFKAQAALIKAYTQLGGLNKNKKIDEPLDFNNVPEDVRKMISTLVDRGRIDIGMETELGKFQVASENIAARGVNKVDRVLRSVGQKMEAINRVSTAIAAYRLELAKTGNIDQATEYADNVISQTHGDYTRTNAPRAFNTNIGKVALQFRKFQLIQLTLLTKLVANSVKGGTKAERTAARKALAFTLGHTAALAGLVGMPGFAAASFILKGLVGMFGDDEEPYNFEKELYEAMVDQWGEDAATLIMRGAPAAAGIDLSGKLGMGNTLSVLPFTDFELSKAGVTDIGFAMTFGASGALAQRFADGLKLISGGEYQRGLEKLAPKGVSDAMKAVRENDEGVTRLNGDVLVPADEIAAWESTAKFFGVPVTSDTKRRFLTDIKFENEKAFKDKAAKLKNQYTKARREGDDTTAVREKWAKLQDERVSEGFKREPLSNLLQAPQAQAKRERETAGGIQFNKQTRRFTQELVGEQ
jgi:hypothetical protein